MRIHFISIGGSVMHQLAIALHLKGYQVTGSDDEIFDPAKSNLAAAGLLPSRQGWHPEDLDGSIDAVILGMHARADNPELLIAQSLDLKIYSFPEYIYHESQNKRRVAIGGSHGKTSTTAMVMHILDANGQQFDYLVGAKLKGFDQSVKVTDAPVIVCEADEYPASSLQPVPKFHFLYPHIAVLTGIAWDHINVFPTFEFYLEQFSIFISRIAPGGVLIYNETDPILKELVEKQERKDIRFLPYGLPAHTIENGRTRISLDGSQTTLIVFGDHNLLNMHAAYLVCRELGLQSTDIVGSMADFAGAAKRLESLYSSTDLNIYRDFAHAPSKVKATIEAVKQQFPDRSLIAVLELHTYSSLNAAFMEQYKNTMALADQAVVFYAPHALEMKKMPPLDKEVVDAGFRKPGLIVFDAGKALKDYLEHLNLENACLLFMSSGTFDGLDIPAFIKKRTK